MEKRMVHAATDGLASLLLPSELLIWLSARRPFLLLLLRLAVLFLMVTPCMLGVGLGMLCIVSSGGRGDMFRDGVLAVILPVTWVALLTWLTRFILRRCWKPSPELLAQNDETVAAELRQEAARQEKPAQAAEVKRVLANAEWFCHGGVEGDTESGIDAWEHPDRDEDICGRGM